MTKRGKIILLSVIISVVLLIGGALIWLYPLGGLQLLADYVGPRAPYDLTQGDALSGPEIGAYLNSVNPNIPVEAGDKMAKYCTLLNVNPAFALAIAEADSSTGRAGVGMHHKNPGNTKISYGRLEELGIGHASYRAGQNFAAFDDWGDGFAAICVTLANYSYYNLNGNVNGILRTYAGNPNPNYYAGVNRLMDRLLANITVLGTVFEDGTAKTVKVPEGEVALKAADGSLLQVVKTDASGAFNFGTLTRNSYTIEASKEGYVNFIYVLSRPHQNNVLEMTLVSKSEILDPEKHPLLAGHGFIKGQVHQILIDPLKGKNIVLKATNLDTKQFYSTTADKNGNYIFYNVPKGNYTVEIQREATPVTGFFYSKNVSLTTEGVLEADFYI